MAQRRIPDFTSAIERTAFRYGSAVAAALVALGLRRILDPLLGATVPFITLFASVAFTAWCCGLGPAILNSLIGLAGAIYWFMPDWSLRVQISAILSYVAFSGLITLLGSSQRESKQKLAAANLQLEQARAHLEERVRERTQELNQKNTAIEAQAETVRQLSADLLRARDEERRRIARELHDSIGQELVALSLSIAALRDKVGAVEGATTSLEDLQKLASGTIQSVRMMSYLLHPPLLDEAGLVPALRWQVEGFSSRSNIDIDLEIPKDLGRLPSELEIAIFRIVQESLTNVYRHSQSRMARVQLLRTSSEVIVEIADEGRGIDRSSQSFRAGVGLPGMRERVKQFGGLFTLASTTKGTTVRASFPLRSEIE